MAKHSLWMTALLWVGITTAVQAQQRDLHELDSIANSVFTTNTGARAIGSPLKMSLKSSEVLQADSLATREAFYIYTPTNKSEERFVIVSGDQRMPAILGYSDESNFDLTHIPDGLKWFLKKCEADAYLASQDFTETRASDAVGEKEEFPVIEPLLGKRAWGQDAPFNQQCPAMGSGHAKTGCVTTALAQIMAYHRHPATYDWDNMPDSYDGNYTQEQVEAVAKLMHDIGEACKMEYGQDVSLAKDEDAVSTLLNSQFGYDDEIRLIKKKHYNEENWTKLLTKELSEGKPIYYGGTDEYEEDAHAFILDGLNKNGYFHVNWGWTGSHNGYFKLNSLKFNYSDKNGKEKEKDYSYNCVAIIHIHPNDNIAEKDPTYIVANKIISQNGWDKKSTRSSSIKLEINGFKNERHLTFTGEAQILLASENDTLISRLGTPSKLTKEFKNTQSPFAKRIILEGNLPADLPNGTYHIYAGVRQKGYEEWGVITGKVEDGTNRGNNYFELVIEENAYYLSPKDIKTPTGSKHRLTLHQQEGALQFTPNTNLSGWDVISTHGTIAAQGGAVSQGEGISVETTSFPTGIYLLRGFGKDGQVSVAKFAKK